MARLQILQLPESAGDDRPPFVLVVDQMQPQRYILGEGMEAQPSQWDVVAKQIGARGSIVVPGTINIPANDVPPLPLLSVQGDSQTAELIHAHEQTRLALCDAFLLSLDATWAQIVETAMQRQRELAGILRDREITDPKLIDLVRETLGVGLVMDRPQRDEVLREACRELQKSEDARRHLNRERDELHAEVGLAQGQLHSAALSAVRGKHATIRELIERAEQAEGERNEARMWARYGYEIGQRHCSWSDHGVAPDWLTNGWPNSFDSCEHLQKAAEYDTAICRALEVVNELEAADVHGSAWDANQEAARRIREVLRPSSPGNEPTVKP